MQPYANRRNPGGGFPPGENTYYIVSPGRHPVGLQGTNGQPFVFQALPSGCINHAAQVTGVQAYPVAGHLQDQLQGFPLLIGLGVVAAGLISWYFVNFDYEYSDALADVASYANFNFWKKEVPWYEAPVYMAWPKRFDNNFVQNVVNAYMNLVLDNDSLPEYSAYSPDIQKQLFTELSKILPYSVRDMQYILNAVDFAVSDGTVKILAMKLPRTARNHQRLYSQPQIVQEELKKFNAERDKSLLEQVTDLLSTIGIIGAVAGITIGGFWLYSLLPKRG